MRCPECDGTDDHAAWCPWNARLLAEATMKAKLGDEVTTPRGGMPAFVAYVFPDGGRLLTSDGGTLCQIWHEDDCSYSETAYYEYVGGQRAGSHGWFCTMCRRIVQTG